MRNGIGIGALLFVAIPAMSQEGTTPQRIAVINMAEVFKKYARVVDGRKEIDALMAPYRERADAMRAEMAETQKILSNPMLDAVERMIRSKRLVDLKRRFEDLEGETRQTVSKRQEQLIGEFYQDVQSAVNDYADAHEIDLVLIYGEAVKNDRTPQSATRKINVTDQGGVTPIFIRGRVEITQPVLRRLNEAYAGAK